jgi:5-methylcytosine-specific restriction endonuclease McrA
MRYSVGEIIAMVQKNDLRRFYNSWEWRKLSHQIIEENHSECWMCKQKGRVSKAILTHHVNELKKRPDLAYSRTYTDENGKLHKQLVPLCWLCHERIHERGEFAFMNMNTNHYNNEERW